MPSARDHHQAAREIEAVTALGGTPHGVSPALAVVIPVRNQARELRRCIEALLDAGAAQDMIVVVDDASTDDTAATASSLGVRVVQRTRCGGPAAARNDGVRHTDADLVLFVDADVVVAPDALARVRQVFRGAPDIAALFGSYDDAPAASRLVSRYRNLLHHFVHQGARRDAATFWAGCGAVRRRAFDSVGGYDEARRLNYIEDIELGMRLRRAGHRIRLDPTLLAKHLKRWTLWTMVRTDLLYRALPWSRLMLASGGLIDDLNLTRGQRLSVALTGAGGLCALLAPAAPMALALAGLAALGVVILNARLFLFLRATGGAPFAAACLPLHLVHLACGGIGFAWAWLETRIRFPPVPACATPAQTLAGHRVRRGGFREPSARDGQ